MKNPWKNGEIFIWGTAATVTITFSILVVLIVVIVVNGLGYFWPKDISLGNLKDGGKIMGEITARENIPTGGKRLQFKIGNRDLYGLDFKWIAEAEIIEFSRPEDAVVLERRESGNFFGFLKSVYLVGKKAPQPEDSWGGFTLALEGMEEKQEVLREREGELAEISQLMTSLRMDIQKLTYYGIEKNGEEIAILEGKLAGAEKAFEKFNSNISTLRAYLRRNTATFTDANGQEKTIVLLDIVRTYRPNALSTGGKLLVYLSRLGELLTDEPRESNTEGGLMPAIFGTVLMVMIMSLFCIPLGVVAAIYLREYAKEGILVRLVRIAIYNLAGVPSIVYGVFGLGFFVYGVGGGIDRMFFPERLPSPTFGTGGILWASLTLSLLTVPVVIVTTEEAIAAIPKGIREGSLSLGATQFQTLVRVLLPMASPGILTGFILAMARAAGEVAPLMITGVVKLAPTLPLDGNFPYLHLERKFMHLGFHIFDVGFQSPNVEAAKPMVYITTLLLVLIVLGLSIIAIYLRNKMRQRYQTATF